MRAYVRRVSCIVRHSSLARLLQHSHSNLRKSQRRSEVFGLHRRQRFRDGIGHHVVRRAVGNRDVAVFYVVANEMETNVDVLRSRVIPVILRQCDRALAAQEDSGRVERCTPDFVEVVAQPEGLLRSVCERNVLGFGGRLRDDVLTFR